MRSVSRAKLLSLDHDFRAQDRTIIQYKNKEEEEEDQRRVVFDEDRDGPARVREACRRMMRSGRR